MTTALKSNWTNVPIPCPVQHGVVLTADDGFITVTAHRTDGEEMSDDDADLLARLEAAVKTQQARLDTFDERRSLFSSTVRTREGTLVHGGRSIYRITVSAKTNALPSDHMDAIRSILRAANGDGMRCILT